MRLRRLTQVFMMLTVGMAGIAIYAGDGLDWTGDPAKLPADNLIDFGGGMPAGEYTKFTNVKNRSVKDGRLCLILESNKDSFFSVPNVLMMKPAGCYRGIELRMKLKARQPSLAMKEGLSLVWMVDGEESRVQIPLQDAEGKGFYTYWFDLSGNPKWDGKLNSVQVPLSFGQEDPAGTEVEIECLRVRLTRDLEAANKTFQAALRMFYLADVVEGFRKQGIEVKGLAEDIAGFRKEAQEAEEARLKHQKTGKPEDLDRACASIAGAEERLKIFYPHIEVARKVVDIKDEIERLQEVQALYSGQGRNVSIGEILKKNCTELVDCLKRGEFDLDEKIKAVEEKIEAQYVKLDQESPYGLPMRLGLSQTSFGRFGWSPVKYGEGLLVYNVDTNVFIKEHGNFKFECSPGEAEMVKAEKKDVNWASFRKSYQYRDKKEGGKEIRWDTWCSLLAPGVLVDTDSAEMRFSGGGLGPDKIVLGTKEGTKLVELKEGENSLDMAENWLVLLWDKVGEGKKFSAVILVLEKKPEKVESQKEYLSFRIGKGIGRVGVVDYAGVMPFDRQEIKKWEEGDAKEVADKCRRIAEVMMNYPIRCKEYFGVDEKNRKILIRNEFEYLKTDNEWKTGGVEYAPLPPLLNFVKDEGYPVEIKEPLVDFEIPTKYGPYRAAKGTSIEYRIPVPDFYHRAYLCTSSIEGDVPKFLLSSYKGMRCDTAGELDHLSGWNLCAALQAWNLITPAVRDGLIGQLGRQQDIFFNILSSGLGTLADVRYQGRLGIEWGPCRPFLDRVEPFTGKQYLIGGTLYYRAKGSASPSCMMNSMGFEALGDAPNITAHFLWCMQYYAAYSGNWDYVRERWDLLKRMSVCYRRIHDWANFAIPYHEEGAATHYDMGPDCLKGPIATMQMAKIVGDEELYRWSTYVASKTAMAMLAQYPMGEYFKKYHGAPLPERICWEYGLSEWGLPTSDRISAFAGKPVDVEKSLIVNTISGCAPMSEILDLRAQYITAPYKRFLYETYPALFPDWQNMSFRREGPKALLGRGYLLADAKEKQEFIKECRETVLPVLPRGYGAVLYSMLPLVLLVQGLEAPCYLVSWAPYKVVAGTYDPAAGIAMIEVDGKTAGSIQLRSEKKPLGIKDNGQALPPDQWSYEEARRLLTVRSGPGKHRFEISFTGELISKVATKMHKIHK